jgi:hypothetical protein
MSQTANLAEIPLTCTAEVAKVIYDELTFGGRNIRNGEVLVTVGADWQKNRIRTELEAMMAELKTKIAKIETRNGLDDTEKAFIEIQYKVQVMLLQSIIDRLI